MLLFAGCGQQPSSKSGTEKRPPAAAPTAKDELDATALHYAVIKENAELIELLMARGADLYAPLNSKAVVSTYRKGDAPNPFGGQSADGQTPVSLARSQKIKQIFEPFLKKEKK